MSERRKVILAKIVGTLRNARAEELTIDEEKFLLLIMAEHAVTRRTAREYLVTAQEMLRIADSYNAY